MAMPNPLTKLGHGLGDMFSTFGSAATKAAKGFGGAVESVGRGPMGLAGEALTGVADWTLGGDVEQAPVYNPQGEQVDVGEHYRRNILSRMFSEAPQLIRRGGEQVRQAGPQLAEGGADILKDLISGFLSGSVTPETIAKASSFYGLKKGIEPLLQQTPLAPYASPLSKMLAGVGSHYVGRGADITAKEGLMGVPRHMLDRPDEDLGFLGMGLKRMLGSGGAGGPMDAVEAQNRRQFEQQLASRLEGLQPGSSAYENTRRQMESEFNQQQQAQRQQNALAERQMGLHERTGAQQVLSSLGQGRRAEEGQAFNMQQAQRGVAQQEQELANQPGPLRNFLQQGALAGLPLLGAWAGGPGGAVGTSALIDFLGKTKGKTQKPGPQAQVSNRSHWRNRYLSGGYDGN